MLRAGDRVWISDAVQVTVAEVFLDDNGDVVSFYGQGTDGMWHAARLVDDDGRPVAELDMAH